MNVTVGRIVNYVLPSGPYRGEVRPCMVVRVWSGNLFNGQVFTDSPEAQDSNDCLPPVMWATSVVYNEDKHPGTWHWPEEDAE